MKSSWLRIPALLLAFVLVAAACGSDDDDSSGADTTTTDESTSDGSDAGDTDTDTDDGENSASAGSDGGNTDADDGMSLPTEGSVEIAAGTVLNLAECPDDWSVTQGADGDEVRIGTSLPQSGPVAAFGPIADGMQAYFDWVNANDPVDGKQIVLVARDDAYESGRTLANVEEMLETEDLLAFTHITGSPNNAAIRPILDEACVPQLFNATGIPDWGDPANFPWTIGGVLAYNTEANLWCENIVAEVGEGATVAGLFMNNDFGAAYQDGVERCADEGLIDLVANEVHEAAAPDIANEMTNMIASDAQVFILGSTAGFCPQAVGGVAASSWRPAFYMSNTCSNLAAFFVPVQDAAAALAAEGSAVRMAAYIKDFTDPTNADDPAIELGKQVLADAGLDEVGSQTTGVLFGYVVEQTLRTALERYGELNRVTLMAAAHNLDIENPYLFDGVTTITDGVNDAYMVEAARIDQVVLDGDTLAFEPISELISVEGTTGAIGS